MEAGNKFPQVTLTLVNPDGNGEFAIEKDVDSLQYFAGKKTVIVAVPGAFTPTCHANHIPPFVAKLQEFEAKGAKVVGMAVNDCFVVQAWAKALGANFPFIADGSGVLTKALNAEADLTEHGLGMRSRRFTLVVDNDTITQVNDEGSPGFTDISTAETVLNQL